MRALVAVAVIAAAAVADRAARRRYGAGLLARAGRRTTVLSVRKPS